MAGAGQVLQGRNGGFVVCDVKSNKLVLCCSTVFVVMCDCFMCGHQVLQGRHGGAVAALCWCACVFLQCFAGAFAAASVCDERFGSRASASLRCRADRRSPHPPPTSSPPPPTHTHSNPQAIEVTQSCPPPRPHPHTHLPPEHTHTHMYTLQPHTPPTPQAIEVIQERAARLPSVFRAAPKLRC